MVVAAVAGVVGLLALLPVAAPTGGQRHEVLRYRVGDAGWAGGGNHQNSPTTVKSVESRKRYPRGSATFSTPIAWTPEQVRVTGPAGQVHPAGNCLLYVHRRCLQRAGFPYLLRYSEGF